MPSRLTRLIATVRDRDGAPIDVRQHIGDDLAVTLEFTDARLAAVPVELTTEDAVRLATSILYAVDTRTAQRPDVWAQAQAWGVAFLAIRRHVPPHAERAARPEHAVVDLLDPADVTIRPPRVAPIMGSR